MKRDSSKTKLSSPLFKCIVMGLMLAAGNVSGPAPIYPGPVSITDDGENGETLVNIMTFAEQLQSVVDSFDKELPYAAEVMAKYGIKVVIGENTEPGRLGYYNLSTPDRIYIDRDFPTKVWPRDIRRELKHTIMHELTHAEQDRAGITKDIKRLPLSYYLAAELFSEIDADAKATMNLEPEKYRDVALRDELVRSLCQMRMEILRDAYIPDMIRNNAAGLSQRSLADFDGLLKRISMTGNPEVAGYSDRLLGEIHPTTIHNLSEHPLGKNIHMRDLQHLLLIAHNHLTDGIVSKYDMDESSQVKDLNDKLRALSGELSDTLQKTRDPSYTADAATNRMLMDEMLRMQERADANEIWNLMKSAIDRHTGRAPTPWTELGVLGALRWENARG